MWIWATLLVSVFAGAVLWFKHRRQVVLWEFGALFVATFLLVVGIKSTVELMEVSDTEFWGGWTTKVEYYEPWDEKVSCQHPVICSMPSICTDMDGNTYSCIEDVYCYDEHDFDVRENEARYVLYGSNGEETNVSQAVFEDRREMWGSPTFTDLNRDFYSYDGDLYTVSWSKGEDVLPLTTEHTYENRLQGENDLVTWEKVDLVTQATYGLYDYPELRELSTGFFSEDVALQNAIQGDAGRETAQANDLLMEANALMGKSHQLKMFVFIYHNQLEEAAYWQEQMLKGGNKNEFILLISIDDAGRVLWSKVISWTEEADLKEDVAGYAMEYGELRLLDTVSYMIDRCEQDWVRKEFSDYSFVKVKPSLGATILAWILTILANLALSFWIINNDHKNVDYSTL